MATQSEQQASQAATYANLGYQSASALQIRLETQEILDKIRNMLLGIEIIPEMQKDGKYVLVQKKTGMPYVNDIGQQGIMTVLQTIVNAQVVQGSYTEEEYSNSIFTIHTNLAEIFITNSRDWGIKDCHRKLLISSIMNLVRPFLSRLKDNKERESYAQTMRTVESNTLQQKDRRFGL